MTSLRLFNSTKPFVSQCASLTLCCSVPCADPSPSSIGQVSTITINTIAYVYYYLCVLLLMFTITMSTIIYVCCNVCLLLLIPFDEMLPEYNNTPSYVINPTFSLSLPLSNSNFHFSTLRGSIVTTGRIERTVGRGRWSRGVSILLSPSPPAASAAAAPIIIAS